ncbi:beta-hydroxydecanoyl-ACP dehydratase [Nocardia sp. BMG111209]|uniref:beta-hydroxydecanoyl-ACP dehydratase n=1 Tax=Nocardia sp. BMG111209 TaxID=1160137 RepID=UPI0012DD8520|nr:beta-hydroxydecanoyl-ACP dehydratase [Nocardia sp. BMG111209]
MAGSAVAGSGAAGSVPAEWAASASRPVPTRQAAVSAGRTTGPRGGDPVSQLLQDFRAELVSAHLSAMAVQTALQRQALNALGRPAPVGAGRSAYEIPAVGSRPAHQAPAVGSGSAQHAPAAGSGSGPAQHASAVGFGSAHQASAAGFGPAQHASAAGSGSAYARSAPEIVAEQAYTVTLDYAPETGLTVTATPGRDVVIDSPQPATSMSAFKALARTPVTALDGRALAALARGEIAAVFGSAYDQEGVNPAVRLTEGAHGTLIEVLDIARHAGAWRRGRLRAAGRIDGPDLVAAVVEIAWQTAQVFAMQVGLQLCLADARFHSGTPLEADLLTASAGPVEVVAEVVRIDLIPRPRLRIDAEFRRGAVVVARVRALALEIREAPGLPVGPEAGGVIPRFFGRRNSFGDRALLGEFHMTHSARGDLDIALGPEFTRYAGRRATRMPNHGLQLCDRVMAVDGRRGKLTGGTGHTEYDSPADSWYYAESANASMPNVVYMETSLQSALLLGYFLGATLTAPQEDYSLRNLDGTATVLREVDLRDKTIQQTSTLLNTTVLVGAVLQTFSYELSVDGEPFYSGESLFGFFNARALANQNGLDNGEFVPAWLDAQPSRPAVRVIDVAARRAAGTGMRCATGHLAMLDEIEIVDGAGNFGLGYLRAARPVQPDDWFFGYHFHLDPVMPGSLGVEAVIQAMQEWAVDAGLAAELVAPEFVLPVGVPMSWRYRGQILADEKEMSLEVHIKSVERRPGRVRVIGDASVWKPRMRIYELLDVAIELRGVGADTW